MFEESEHLKKIFYCNCLLLKRMAISTIFTSNIISVVSLFRKWLNMKFREQTVKRGYFIKNSYVVSQFVSPESKISFCHYPIYLKMKKSVLEFTHGFQRVSCCSIFIFIVCLFSFVYYVLYYIQSVLRFTAFAMESSTFSFWFEQSLVKL